MILRNAEKEELSEIARYMVCMNQSPETKCAYIGTDYEDVLSYLEEIYEENKERFFIIKCEDQLVGVIAGDICDDNRSIEVIGPFVSCDRKNRYEVANKLLEALMGVLPEYRYSFYVDCANTFVAEIVLSGEGRKLGEQYIMSLGLGQDEDKKRHLTGTCLLYQNSDLEQESVKTQIEKLHNKLFPTAYYNGKTILEHTDDEHFIMYCMDGGQVVSYAYFNTEEDGYLDFIGTDPDYRRQGYAKVLLAQMVECLRNKKCTKLELCVDGKDKEAIALYQLFGFRIEEKNQAFIINRNSK